MPRIQSDALRNRLHAWNEDYRDKIGKRAEEDRDKLRSVLLQRTTSRCLYM
jgi:hypothetical protein